MNFAATYALSSPFGYLQAAKTGSQVLADASDIETASKDHDPHIEHKRSVDPNLVFELEHLEDILRTIAESLRSEQKEESRVGEEQKAGNEETAQDQPPAAGWFGSCVLM